MKYQRGSLEHRDAFEAPTEQVAEAVVGELGQKPYPGSAMAETAAASLGDAGFTEQVNYCILYLSMFTRRSVVNPHDQAQLAERLSPAELSPFPDLAMIAAAALLDFPRAVTKGELLLGISEREGRWILAQSFLADARSHKGSARRGGRQEPPRWADFRDGRGKFAVGLVAAA
ncbi:hypothetical protein [Arthrobacter sp. STN4]|uniref:hypothetical protein n=1 Tax=Arthrobacter sp. STN4 TaxID=2923276 RepID=UPI002119F40E|nr:hypothetical protein [Arthrobacter sp. STN4]MCQ9162974.1 hypothetical protein [Arthrobacter sp. STN4]